MLDVCVLHDDFEYAVRPVPLVLALPYAPDFVLEVPVGNDFVPELAVLLM